ncbi:3433_t:CDS:2 [Racocetra persica]|uniref:3433_t:CDS:1 n=1 Tax=Racocetra persica TaxID=160502 RepID=A0ACA9LQE9_9GLOM|nr:3433_t:CDS:2 [Racocetra persica]
MLGGQLQNLVLQNMLHKESIAEQETINIFRQQIKDLIKENDKLKLKNEELTETRKQIKNLIQKNNELKTKNEELTEAVKQIKNLIQENNELKTKNKKLTESNQRLEKINDAQNLLLRDAIDKAEFYKTGNFQEFDTFIYNYIFGLLD